MMCCWFWFLDYFKNPENRQFRFFEQKSESKNYQSRLFQKPEKDWRFSGKNQPIMASGLMAGYLRIMVIYKTQVLDFLELHFQLQRTALITVRGSFPVSNKHPTLLVYLLYSTLELRQEINPRPPVFRGGVSSCKSLGNNTSAGLGFKGWCTLEVLRAKCTDLWILMVGFIFNWWLKVDYTKQ